MGPGAVRQTGSAWSKPAEATELAGAGAAGEPGCSRGLPEGQTVLSAVSINVLGRTGHSKDLALLQAQC